MKALQLLLEKGSVDIVVILVIDEKYLQRSRE